MNKDKKYFETEATQEEYLVHYKEKEKDSYEKPSVTNDSLIFSWNNKTKEVELLLLKREQNPFKGKYALPGSFIGIDEEIDDSVIRTVKTKTNIDLDTSYVELLQTFGKVDRDPRMRIITIAHNVYLPYNSLTNVKLPNNAVWFSISLGVRNDFVLTNTKTKEILTEADTAFDHFEIIQKGCRTIKNKLNYKPTILKVLPKEFTLTEARKCFGCFKKGLRNAPNSSNFLKVYGDFFKKLNKKREKVVGRPSDLYTYKKKGSK